MQLQYLLEEILKRAIVENHFFTYGPYIDTISVSNLYKIRFIDLINILDNDSRYKEYDVISYKIINKNRIFTKTI